MIYIFRSLLILLICCCFPMSPSSCSKHCRYYCCFYTNTLIYSFGEIEVFCHLELEAWVYFMNASTCHQFEKFSCETFVATIWQGTLGKLLYILVKQSCFKILKQVPVVFICWTLQMVTSKWILIILFQPLSVIGVENVEC